MAELAALEGRKRIYGDDLAIDDAAKCIGSEALSVPASASTCAEVRLRRHLAVAEPVPEPQPAATDIATPVASAESTARPHPLD